MARAIDLATLEEDTVREALEFISQGLRTADRDELRATLGAEAAEDPFWTLMESVEVSDLAYVILDSTGLPIAVFGVAPHTAAGLGVAWFLGTDGVERESISVARQTRQYVGALQEIYPVLWANVDARNELSMNWLERAGFAVHDLDLTHGLEGRPFLQFLRTR